MKSLFDRLAFSIDEENYYWRDVILAANYWGEWAPLAEETRLGLACLKHLESRRELPEAAEVESAVNEFRHAHILISAEETKAWLASWELSVAEWKQYFWRSLARQNYAAGLQEVASVPDGEVERAIKSEAICSGRLARLALKLAGRAAVAEKLNQEESSSRRIGFGSLPYDEEKLEALARMEAAFNQFCERVATDGAIKHRIASNYIYWTRLDSLSISFPEEQPAREAALCVLEDKMSLDEVAEDARRAIRRRSFYIEDVEPELIERLLGSQKGDLVGPVPLGGEWVLFLIDEKILPSESDPDVRARARLALLKSAVGREINNRVKWHIGLLPGMSSNTFL